MMRVWFSTGNVALYGLGHGLQYFRRLGHVGQYNVANACLTLMAHFDADSYLDLSTANLFVKSSAPAIWDARLSGFI
jgi:hypothetical protein